MAKYIETFVAHTLQLQSHLKFCLNTVHIINDCLSKCRDDIEQQFQVIQRQGD